MTKLCLFVLLWLLLLCLSVERGGRSVDMTVGSLHFIKRPIYLQNNNLKQTNIDLFWYQLHLEVWLMWMNYDSRSSLSHLCLFLPRQKSAFVWESQLNTSLELLLHFWFTVKNNTTCFLFSNFLIWTELIQKLLMLKLNDWKTSKLWILNRLEE